jgi:hypothetical protein
MTSSTTQKPLICINLYEPSNGLAWCAEILAHPQPTNAYEQTFQFYGQKATVFVYTNDHYTRADALEIVRRILYNDGVKQWSIDLTQ